MTCHDVDSQEWLDKLTLYAMKVPCMHVAKWLEILSCEACLNSSSSQDLPTLKIVRYSQMHISYYTLIFGHCTTKKHTATVFPVLGKAVLEHCKLPSINWNYHFVNVVPEMHKWHSACNCTCLKKYCI